MARPRKNPAGSPLISLRMPLELLEQLKQRGELTAQIVEAVRVYLAANVMLDELEQPAIEPRSHFSPISGGEVH